MQGEQDNDLGIPDKNDSIISEDDIESVRAFNSFYTFWLQNITRLLGANAGDFTQIRVLHRLYVDANIPAAIIQRDLGLSPGYLSRVLHDLENRGLIVRHASETDKRSSNCEVTEDGLRLLAPIISLSRRSATSMLRKLSPQQRAETVSAMKIIYHHLRGLR